ncbi:hypothetical protein PUNSTDRAFT_129295 [Punctularia strigosozonata HHB-11173 SS5]|uniref:uncharacterized protein n=1 Tax=Punctularia strigosozonata (strain HHB-11173) TaxID=741275 RepID=UPI0004416B9F|nr:uncharacterized protein PUNSTDRAFT_129295 [Punctularia strigosozonata HHB-11173 SS5]EIN13617.1 hypothetical protein PUNSTDRAFT_129295 [Punctularia strigosozonata HHB-11173 SS5]
MVAQSVNIQKQRYAHELAEYTMKQYDMARRSAEQGRPPSASVPEEQIKSPNGRDGSRLRSLAKTVKWRVKPSQSE